MPGDLTSQGVGILRRTHGRQMAVVGLLATIVTAVGVMNRPAATWAGILGFGILALGLYSPAFIRGLFLLSMLVLLMGYAAAGRGFAYLGMPPVFVGEVVLSLGVAAWVLGSGSGRILKSPLVLLLGIFCFWCTIRTVAGIFEYGVDALRDGVIWGYSLFALVITAFLTDRRAMSAAIRVYARLIPVYLILAPVAILLSRLAESMIPLVPGTDVPLLQLKSGDAAVHLIAIGTFLLLGLHRGQRDGKQILAPGAEWILWTCWAGGIVLCCGNRASVLAILAGITVVAAFRPNLRWRKMAVVILVIVFLAIVSDARIDLRDGRQISARRLISTMSSITGSTEEGFEGSRTWRLDWWEEIVSYTVFGEYFWTGKGFGINLATDDEFQVLDDYSLRSPHNGHLTILARAGVPGALLWLALLVGFGWSLVRAHRRFKAAGESWWAGVTLWLLSYWLAAIIVASFDVVLEGPQGGIWYWCLFGAGISLIYLSKRTQENGPGPAERLPAAPGALAE